MRFEKLNDTKIRIILTIQDMESNNISFENVLSNSTASQKLLESMISKAETEIGFYAEDSKLLVEAIMTSNEECIFTITKLHENTTCSKKCCKSFIFKFDSFDDFIDLCVFLKSLPNLNLKNFSKKFSLILYNDTYYLKALDADTFSITFDYMRTFFSEFGEDVSNSCSIDGILNEYGKIIFDKNAISKCIRSFI